jgi:hypothetical protein
MTFSYDAHALNPRLLVRKTLYSLALSLVHCIKQRRAGLRTPSDSSDNITHRPLIFIAHSLGGLIVQRGLVIASESSDLALQDIELSTTGLLFFGTPATDQAEELARSIIKIARYSTSKRRRLGDAEEKIIRQDAGWFKSDMEAFKPIALRLRLEPFVESQRTTLRSDSSHSSLVSMRCPSVATPVRSLTWVPFCRLSINQPFLLQICTGCRKGTRTLSDSAGRMIPTIETL